MLTWYCQLRFLSIFRRRYLTLSVGYSLLPHNLYFKSPSDFSCFDLKITISDYRVFYFCTISVFYICLRWRVQIFDEITTKKAEKYPKVWGPRACLCAFLILTKKYSAWVYWKVLCHFWPIKPHDLSPIDLYHSFGRQIMVLR